jgi:hypothetical protein
VRCCGQVHERHTCFTRMQMLRPKARAGRPCGDDLMESSKDVQKAPLRSCQHRITEARSHVKEGLQAKNDPEPITFALRVRPTQIKALLCQKDLGPPTTPCCGHFCRDAEHLLRSGLLRCTAALWNTQMAQSSRAAPRSTGTFDAAVDSSCMLTMSRTDGYSEGWDGASWSVYTRRALHLRTEAAAARCRLLLNTPVHLRPRHLNGRLQTPSPRSTVGSATRPISSRGCVDT